MAISIWVFSAGPWLLRARAFSTSRRPCSRLRVICASGGQRSAPPAADCFWELMEAAFVLHTPPGELAGPRLNEDWISKRTSSSGFDVRQTPKKVPRHSSKGCDGLNVTARERDHLTCGGRSQLQVRSDERRSRYRRPPLRGRGQFELPSHLPPCEVCAVFVGCC